jgi:transposase
MTSAELRQRFEKSFPGRRVKDAEVDFVVVSQELLRKGVTLLLLWEEYLQQHPDGYSYSQFCNRYRDWRKLQNISLRQEHRAGDALYVDYAGLTMPVINQESGEVRQVPIFVAALGASNRIYTEATEDATLASWIGSHVRTLTYFGGVPGKIVPDNLKTGVKNPCRYDPELNPSYREFAEHYGVAVLPARPKKPQDKAKVESAVQVVEQRILAKLRDHKFFGVSELNAAISELLLELDNRPMQIYGKSRRELFEELDKVALKPLPVEPYRFASWKKAKVNIDYHVEVKRHYYSVPYQLIHQYVQVRLSEKTVEILHEQSRVALHHRDDTPGRHTTLKEHMPAAHQYMQGWTPSRLIEWAATIGVETKLQVNSLLLSKEHPEHAYRACLGLLSLAKKYGNSRLENACAKANALGIISMRSIKSMLQTCSERILKPQNVTVRLRHSNIRGDAEFH